MKRLLSSILAAGAITACTGTPPATPPSCDKLTVTAISPAIGYTQKSTLVKITGTDFDATSAATLGTGAAGTPVALQNATVVAATAAGGPSTISGATPTVASTLGTATDDSGGTAVDVVVTSAGHLGTLTDPKNPKAGSCKATLTGGWRWNDHDREPLSISSQVPAAGANAVSVLAQLVVTFDYVIVDASATTNSINISGVTGTVTVDSSHKIVTFAPVKALDYSQTYTATVQGDKTHASTDIKKQSNNKGLPDDVTWNFQTRCEGCLNPWLGDISAASGFTQSAHYKLYSTTGQPTPVGETTSTNYHLKSGFVHASQTQ